MKVIFSSVSEFISVTELISELTYGFELDSVDIKALMNQYETTYGIDTVVSYDNLLTLVHAVYPSYSDYLKETE